MSFWLLKSKKCRKLIAALGLGGALWLCPGFGLGCAWSQASYFFHEVQAGETLWSISKAYGISVERLQEFNGGLQGSIHIKAGEFLIVPADVLERPQMASAAKPSGDNTESAVLPASVFGGEAQDEAPLPELALVAPVQPELALVSPVEADKPQAVSSVSPLPSQALDNKKAAGQTGQAVASSKPKQQAEPSSADKKARSKNKSGRASEAKPKANAGQASQGSRGKDKNKSGGSKPASGAAGSGAGSSQSQDKSKDKSKNDAELAYNTSSASGQTVSGGRWKRGHAPKADKGTPASAAGGETKTKTPEEMVAFAKKFLGTPYVYGGDTPAGFDCSGFVQSVCRYAGVNIPRVADDQYYQAGKPVPKGQEREGDLVFFETDPSWPGPSHVGICLGNGEFIHASSSGSVRIDSLDKEYYKARYFGSKRVLEG